METAIHFFSDPTAHKLLMPTVHKARKLLVSMKNISPVMPNENRAYEFQNFQTFSCAILKSFFTDIF